MKKDFSDHSLYLVDGTASLEYIAGRSLPALEALSRR